jgi:hypothetical protein
MGLIGVFIEERAEHITNELTIAGLMVIDSPRMLRNVLS